MQGYNPISMFGRGAAGAIDKRMGNIMQTCTTTSSCKVKYANVLEERQRCSYKQRETELLVTIRDASGTITGGSGQGTIDSGNHWILWRNGWRGSKCCTCSSGYVRWRSIVTKDNALQRIDSHEKLCRIMQKQTHDKIHSIRKSNYKSRKNIISIYGSSYHRYGWCYFSSLTKTLDPSF